MQKAKFIAITDVNRNILATFASQKKNSRSIRRETGVRQAGSFSPAAGFFIPIFSCIKKSEPAMAQMQSVKR